MSKVWYVMIVCAVGVLVFTSPETVVSEMLSASASSLTFCINLVSIYAIWLGILEIANKTGIVDSLSKCLSPIIKKVFRSNNDSANKYIAVNFSANILGLGNVATPSGIKAMELLDDKTGKPTYSMIMLLIINTTSISLLPTTTIGIRESCQSTNSTSIILPTIVTSVITLIVGIFLVWLCFGRKARVGASE